MNARLGEISGVGKKTLLTETHDRRNYSRPRSRAIAPVNRLTGFVPPTLFDRARTGARRGKN
jgi:hypothetical protein